MQTTLSHAELTEWMAFANLAPFGPEVDDRRAALAMTIAANPHRSRHAPAYKPDDFRFGGLAREERATPEPTADSRKATANRILEHFTALKAAQDAARRRDVTQPGEA